MSTFGSERGGGESRTPLVVGVIRVSCVSCGSWVARVARIARVFAVVIALASVVTAGLATPALAAKDPDVRRHPGFVDGSEFARLAGEDSELVEVNIGPSLLGTIARGADDDPEARSVLSGLLHVSAYVVGLDHDADREGRAAKLVKEIVESLDRSGWEHLVKVREKGESANVYIRSNGKTIDGLVVVVFDRDDSEVVFANLVGSIDLARLGELDGTLDVPGLDAIGGGAEKMRAQPDGAAATKRDAENRREAPQPGESPRGDAGGDAS